MIRRIRSELAVLTRKRWQCCKVENAGFVGSSAEVWAYADGKNTGAAGQRQGTATETAASGLREKRAAKQSISLKRGSDV